MDILPLKAKLAQSLNELSTQLANLPAQIQPSHLLQISQFCTDAQHFANLASITKEALYASVPQIDEATLEEGREEKQPIEEIGFNIQNHMEEEEDEVEVEVVPEKEVEIVAPNPEPIELTEQEETFNIPVPPPVSAPTFFEPIVTPTQPPLVTSKVPTTSTPIKSLISLNDKFLYIKELFKGDFEAYNTCIDELDRLPNLSTANNYIQENFVVPYEWAKNEEFAERFTGMLERKYGK